VFELGVIPTVLLVFMTSPGMEMKGHALELLTMMCPRKISALDSCVVIEIMQQLLKGKNREIQAVLFHTRYVEIEFISHFVLETPRSWDEESRRFPANSRISQARLSVDISHSSNV
jgi:hypothetical protein